MQHELLAPAGNLEAGYAALYYGADAIYLGLNKFSARANAQNFTYDELDEITAYAHSLHKRVFVALNTILSEEEIKDLPEMFAAIRKAKVDGLIVQDLGVVYLARKWVPEIELHASTQMAVHNLEGARFLQSLGFKRVVLARELSLSEIKKIAAALPDLDLEVFVHGALCYSYSGQCLFSALEYGKSANKGGCVYPCRAEFKINGKNCSHLFSMKDLALEDKVTQIPTLSLKIEGRKKSPLYVAAVTNYYRHILDGKKKDINEAEDIKQIFSRPWCNFHFSGKDKDVVDENFVGHRGLIIGKTEKSSSNMLQFKTSHKIARHDGLQIDVKGEEKPYGFGIKDLFVNRKPVFEAERGANVEIKLPNPHPVIPVGSPVYLASSSYVKGKYDYKTPKKGEFRNTYPLDVKIEVEKGKIWAMAEDAAVSLEGNFSPAQDIQKTINAIESSFHKTGGTEFHVESIEIYNPHNLFVPVSIINELRRKLLENINIINQEYILPTLRPSINQNLCCRLSVFHINLHTKIDDFTNLTEKNDTWCVLPQICRNTIQLTKIIDELYANGARKFAVENYYGFDILRKYKDVEIISGSFLYVMNRYAAEMLKIIGCKAATLALENTQVNAEALSKSSPLPLIQVTKCRPPLFTSAVCIRKNSCRECKGGTEKYKLEKDGKVYQAISEYCQVQVFAEKTYERELLPNCSYYFADKESYL